MFFLLLPSSHGPLISLCNLLFLDFSITAFCRFAEERAALLKQCEESVSAKAEENERIKLETEEAKQELLLCKSQVHPTALKPHMDFCYIPLTLLFTFFCFLFAKK